MATKIRLSRLGRKKHPFYRIMVADSRTARDGRHVESIGYYDPLKEPRSIVIQREKVLYWLDKGAIPSLTVRNLLSTEGILLEWELRKQGKPEEYIQEELKKFVLLQELQLKKKQTKQESMKQEKATAAQLENKEQTAEAKIESAKPQSEQSETVSVSGE